MPTSKKTKKDVITSSQNEIDQLIARCELFLDHIGRLDQFRAKMMQIQSV